MEDRLIQATIDGKNNPAEVDREYVLKTYGELNAAAGKGYGDNYYDYSFDVIPGKIRNNLLHFAGQKAYTIQKALDGFLKDAGDEDAFRKRAAQYLTLQDGTYLGVQKSFASRSAQWARDFKTFKGQKDLYPNLKFRTMEDDRVRPSHAILDGVVKPVDSAYVATHATPLGYRCRCMWEQTTEAVTENGEDVENWMPEPQFQANTAKDGTVFNKYTSYAQTVKNDKMKIFVSNQLEHMKMDFPYKEYAKVGNNKIYVSDFVDPNDVKENLAAAGIMADKLHMDIYLRPHRNIEKVKPDERIKEKFKNPEFAIGNEDTLGDLKTFKRGEIDNFIKNSAKSAGNQEVNYLVLDISNNHSEEHLSIEERSSIQERLYGEFKGDYHMTIQNIVLIKEQKVVLITRDEIKKYDFNKLQEL